MFPPNDPIRLATAAILLAEALQALLPDSTLIDRGTEGFTFYCDIVFSKGTFDTFLLEQLERQLKGEIRNDSPISIREMVPSNGEQFLLHVKSLDAQRPLNGSPLALIAEINGRFFAAPHVLLSSTGAIGYCRVCGAEPLENGIWRIRGIAAVDKNELKRTTAAFKRACNRDHRALLQERELLFFSPPILLSRALAWRNHLLSWSLSQSATLGLPIQPLSSDGSPTSVAAYGRSLPTPLLLREERLTFPSPLSPSDGMLSWRHYSGDLCSLLCDRSALLSMLISSLQLIDKSYKMLSIECRWVWRLASPPDSSSRSFRFQRRWAERAIAATSLSGIQAESYSGQQGPRLELEAFDRWGRGHCVAFVELCSTQSERNRAEEHPMVRYSVLCAVERLEALLLEQHAEKLPLWLAPEQLRLLTVSAREESYGSELAAAARQRGIRAYVDASTTPLDRKVFAAERASVPYIAVIGGKEAKNQSINLRGGAEHTLPAEELWPLLTRAVENSNLH